MAPISPGRPLTTVKKAKKQTIRTNKHRFESFSKRIAQLKIDPVHTVQRTKSVADEDPLSTSFFQVSLLDWAELNLSTTFTNFFLRVTPLCGTLPQLLYYADTIFELLIVGIEKKDALALEPLLALTAHLAHDLGQSYTKYFDRTVDVIAKVAAEHESPEVLEWSFTCLAWLFKYLSRVLAPDLRPLLTIMVPYLSSRKAHISRFSAESLAFLLRKAASLHSKKPEYLDLALDFVLSRASEESRTADNYKIGAMTLLAETATGVDGKLHGSAQDLFACLFVKALRSEQTSGNAFEVFEGVFTYIIHMSDKAALLPIYELLFREIGSIEDVAKPADCHRAARLIVTGIATDAKAVGSKIQNWERALGVVHRLSQSLSNRVLHVDCRRTIITTLVVAFQYAPLNDLLPRSSSILDSFERSCQPHEFLAFTHMIAQRDRQRFLDFVLPRLQHFITSYWQDEEAGIGLILGKLHQANILTSRSDQRPRLVCPLLWQKHISSRLSNALSDGSVSEEMLSLYLELPNLVSFSLAGENSSGYQTSVEELVTRALSDRDSPFSNARRIVFSQALPYLISKTEHLTSLEADFWNEVTELPREYWSSASFVQACSSLSNKLKPKDHMSTKSVIQLQHVLVENLQSRSIDLRQASLDLLALLVEPENQVWMQAAVQLLSQLLQTKYNPQTAQEIAMYLRKLPQQQRSVSLPAPLGNVIPSFCLGLLFSYHDQSRQNLCAVIGEMITNTAESYILEVVTRWLQAPGTLRNALSTPEQDEARTHRTGFEDLNVLAAVKLGETTFQDFSEPQLVLKGDVQLKTTTEAPIVPAQSRLIGLQLLLEMPELAERRSRMWTPIFLASYDYARYLGRIVSSDESVSSHTLSPEIEDHNWTLPERKSFLKLIAKFTNPAVLYRSKEVHDVLQELLANGSSEIRSLAVQAMLAWKEPALQQHKDLLHDLADDKTSNLELSSILSDDSDGCRIQKGYRQQLLPDVMRLLFGNVIGKSGMAGSQEDRRRSMIRSLFRLPQHEVTIFLQVAMGRLGDVRLIQDGGLQLQVLDHDILSPDQQYGFLRLMLSILDIEEWQFAPYGRQVLPAILYCALRAGKQSIGRTPSMNEGKTPALVRNVRRTGLACLNALFKYESEVEWGAYLQLVFDILISPGLAHFAIETAQGVSGLLQLYATWAQTASSLKYFRVYDKRLTGVIWDALVVPSAKREVKIFLLHKIALPLLAATRDSSLEPNEAIAIFEADQEKLLNTFAYLLEFSPQKDVLNAVTELISGIVPFVSSIDAASKVLDLLIKLVQEPSMKLPSWTKSKLMKSIHSVLGLPLMVLSENRRDRLFNLASAQYNVFRVDEERQAIGHLLQDLAKGNDQLEATVQTCKNLNAMSSSHLGEIDYDRRLEAFTTVSSVDVLPPQSRGWLPLLHNLIYFARSADDFSIRSNALNSLKQFVHKAGVTTEVDYRNLLTEVVLPAAKKAVREDSEVIRADFVSILGLLIQYLRNEESLNDMVPLLVDNDEEASFFTNILHIQQHRRARAIRRLVSMVDKGLVQATNIVTIFLPLLEKFVQAPHADESDQTVKGQSLAAIVTLLRWVPWKTFKTLFRRYKHKISSTEDIPKHMLRLLDGAADALNRAMDEHHGEKPTSLEDEQVSHLAKSLPSNEVICNEARTNLIPDLAKFVHLKDETEISLRIPAAISAIKLIKLLPEQELALQAAPILLDISHILRSRVQESRDAARRTLSQVVALLGPSSIQFVLKEMRNALTRGYQLHVLSYTLHTILVDSSPHLNQGDLDYCIEDLVSVVLDDIFGSVGQEKENQDYISSMKEVKSSKSFDSLELLARSSSAQSLIKLIQPLEALLAGSLTTKQTRHVDELLRRIGVGLSRSQVATTRELLVFAYQLIQNFYKQKSIVQQQAPMTNDEVNRQRFLVELKASNKTTTGITSPLLYKLPKFALDIVRSTLQKHESLLNPENVQGFLPIIGDALIEAQEDVKVSALRLLSSIIKLPIEQLDSDAQIYISEAVRMVKNATSTNEESAQAALKLLSSFLRERGQISIRESDVTYLLHRVTPDLEEPDRQGVTFNFIRAVLARKIQLPEVYELIDKIGIMMVTNQVRGARDAARGVYVHFHIEYEQHAKRWNKQLKFLLKNLEYEYPEGRQSVMEAVNLLISKKRDSQGLEMISTFFIPVMLRMSSDEHAGCREMAGALLGQLFRRGDQKQRGSSLDLVLAWAEQTEKPILTQLSLQAFGTYLTSGDTPDETRIPAMRTCITKVLQADIDIEQDWELRFHALQLLVKLAEVAPEAVMTQKQANLWSAVRNHLRHPHPWVQSSSLSGIQTFLAKCPGSSLSQLPLICEYGLRFDESAVRTVLKSSVWILKRTDAAENLSMLNVQTLLLLGRCINANGLVMPIGKTDEEQPDAEDEGEEFELSENAEASGLESIPATKYVLDQLAFILRREPPRLNVGTIAPKKYSLDVLTALIPQFSEHNLPSSTLSILLVALQHITDPSIATPRSMDPAFQSSYQSLVDQAHLGMEAIQKKVGDDEYTRLLTTASKMRREKREERRVKRRIEKIADPERSARDKKRKHDRVRERKKQIGGVMKKRRQGI